MSPPIPLLPPFAPFPSAELQAQVDPDDWATAVAAWTSLTEAHLALSDADFNRLSRPDESLYGFLVAVSRETAQSGPAVLGPATGAQPLLRGIFGVTSRLLQSPVTAHQSAALSSLLQWDFIADVCRVHSKKRTTSLLSSLPTPNRAVLETSVAAVKKSLIRDLDDASAAASLEATLDRLNFLLARDTQAAALMMAGSDFLDGLVGCFHDTGSPSLRNVVASTAYLCLLGLADGGHVGLLTDQLYALKAAASVSADASTSSLVSELVTSTPLLSQIERRLDSAGQEGPSISRTKAVLEDLVAFKKPGVGMRPPKRLVRRRAEKGKGVALDIGTPSEEMHARRMAQITQVQDLLPELGSAFVSKLLDEYGEDPEQVVAHLLDDSLPDHLQNVDRSEELPSNTGQADLPPPPPPTPAILQKQLSRTQQQQQQQHILPSRRNIFDDDELDRLAVDASKLHFGKHNPDRTADDILRDRSAAPDKAAILSALAAFDSDDDERDDTYDAEDVGGTVDAAAGEADAIRDPTGLSAAEDEILFKAWKADPRVFDRDAATRKGLPRQRLRDETGMTDEALEGWALMLARDPHKQRRLESRAAMFTGAQNELAPTAWRANPGTSGNEEDSEGDGSGGASLFRGGGANRGRGRGRGGRGGGGGGRGGAGNVAGPTGERETEQARRRKEANKGSRANHNRRDQRARKMARGGFPG